MPDFFLEIGPKFLVYCIYIISKNLSVTKLFKETVPVICITNWKLKTGGAINVGERLG